MSSGWFKIGAALFVCAAVSASGCRWTGQPVAAEQPIDHARSQAIAEYNQAVAVYDTGDYDQASRLFESIRQNALNEQLSRMALFGMTCSRLMAAQNPEAYYNALELWKLWVKQAPLQMEQENPLLFVPIMNSKMLFSRIPFESNEPADAPQLPTVPLWVHLKTKQKIEALEKKIDEGEQAAQQRQKKIETLEKEISKLNEQINALETIDQKMQTKKNAIPSAD